MIFNPQSVPTNSSPPTMHMFLHWSAKRRKYRSAPRMFMHTIYSVSVVLPIIFFRSCDLTIISRLSLNCCDMSSVKWRSDCMSPNIALMAPLVLIRICGFELSSYEMTRRTRENPVEQLLRHRAFLALILCVFVEFLRFLCLLARSLPHSLF